MKILKHIWRVLSAHTGPFQGLLIRFKSAVQFDCEPCVKRSIGAKKTRRHILRDKNMIYGTKGAIVLTYLI